MFVISYVRTLGRGGQLQPPLFLSEGKETLDARRFRQRAISYHEPALMSEDTVKNEEEATFR
jgi:hypothetical protein